MPPYVGSVSSSQAGVTLHVRTTTSAWKTVPGFFSHILLYFCNEYNIYVPQNPESWQILDMKINLLKTLYFESVLLILILGATHFFLPRLSVPHPSSANASAVQIIERILLPELCSSGTLSKLTFVDFSNNNLDRLPTSFSTLSKLETLVVTGNKVGFHRCCKHLFRFWRHCHQFHLV